MALMDDMKKLLSLNMKPRQDGYTDQYLRIIMMKVMLMAACLVGLNWYTDKITCIIPKMFVSNVDIDSNYVSSACWINGLYVYEDMPYHKFTVGYYGIPKDPCKDGLLSDGETLCASSDVWPGCQREENCTPMEKTFFLQHQYMMFFLLSVAALYYSPYILFRKNNDDIKALMTAIEDKDSTGEEIVKNHFNYKVNGKAKQRLRIFGDVIVKVLYVMVSLIAIKMTDDILEGRFLGFGMEWLQWRKLKNSIAHDYMGRRGFPKPGDVLLPSYGICEIHEVLLDKKRAINNNYKFVCEMSQHILYQYVFVIIWFAQVTSIIVSALGLIVLGVDYIMMMTGFLKGAGDIARRMYDHLTLRECYYLASIRKKNTILYGDVIARLKADRLTDGERKPALAKNGPCKV